MLSASELAGRLARDAEAVCRHYLSAGRRAGKTGREVSARHACIVMVAE